MHCRSYLLVVCEFYDEPCKEWWNNVGHVYLKHRCIVKVFCSNERIYFYKKYKLNLYLAAILLALMFQTHKCLYIYLLVLIESIQVVQCAGPVIDIDSVFTPSSCFSYIFLLVLILKLELLYNGFFWHLMWMICHLLMMF